LRSITIGSSVTNIGDLAFTYCTSDGSLFQGQCPTLVQYVFEKFDKTIVYYLPGTTGWTSTFGGRAAVLWNPRIPTSSDTSFGVRAGQFGFNISGNSDLVIVVEACTNLSNPIWTPVGTNTLTGGSSYFSDSHWADYTTRVYRLRSP
jgi:hypothetical protein